MSTIPNTSDLREELQRLSDREAIRQLPILYCHYVRTRNLDAVVNLYARDGVFELSGGDGSSGVHKGHPAIRETFVLAFDRMDPWPFTHNHVIELAGGERAKGFVYAEIRSGTDKHRLAYLGVYEDAYVKEKGEWKFQSRKLTLTPVQG